MAVAVLTLTTALVLLSTALVGLYVQVRRTHAVAARNELRIGEVHEIVNQQRTDMQRYQAVLMAALRKAGVEVPPDESLR